MLFRSDQIKDIKPVITMLGGKVVYDAAARKEVESAKLKVQSK